MPIIERDALTLVTLHNRDDVQLVHHRDALGLWTMSWRSAGVWSSKSLTDAEVRHLFAAAVLVSYRDDPPPAEGDLIDDVNALAAAGLATARSAG